MNSRHAKAWMVLGTGSGVGKSFITAGLCRLFSDAGIRVAPFKAQNMSNNSYVTREGGEMGRAQAVQAECARIEPSVHMNPILLKPSEDNLSQVVIHGKAVGNFRAAEYYAVREKFFSAIQESYEKLSRENEVLIIEGAGSPAEINLKAVDLVNFRIAHLANAQCLLAGDIDRGGVFAWLWGTLNLIEEADRKRIAGLIINKFRGDKTLLEPGLRQFEELSKKKIVGVLPYRHDIWLEEEDAVGLDPSVPLSAGEVLDIAVILLPRISNATDFQLLAQEPGVRVRMVKRTAEWGEPDLVILPGTKATLADLEYLHQSGFAALLQKHVAEGGRLLGICGGFQMMGETIEDEQEVESGKRFQRGLGFFPLRTQFFPEKILRRVKGRVQARIFSFSTEGTVTGYEIHSGTSRMEKLYNGLFEIWNEDRPAILRTEGAIDESGNILGTYLHGLFDEPSFRGAFLSALRKSAGKKDIKSSSPSSSFAKEKNYDKLAGLLREHLEPKFLEQCLKSSSLLV